MKNLYLIIILVLLIACQDHKSDNTPTVWQSIPSPSNILRQEAISFAIGSTVYFGMGHSMVSTPNSDPYYNDLWAYDITAKTWQKMADFPGGARGPSSAFTINGRGYVAFGYRTVCPPAGGLCDFVYYNDIWEYTPTNNTWKKVATLNNAQAPQPLSVVINGKAYIQAANQIFEFDPASYSITSKYPSWAVTPQGSSFAINNKAYFFLGLNNADSERPVFEYDPATNTLTRKKDFPGEARGGFTAFSLNGKGYLVGGLQGGAPFKYFKDVWQYDAVADQWIKFSDYPGNGSYNMTSTVVGNKVFIGSGTGRINGGIVDTNDFWLFQPQ